MSDEQADRMREVRDEVPTGGSVFGTDDRPEEGRGGVSGVRETDERASGAADVDVHGGEAESMKPGCGNCSCREAHCRSCSNGHHKDGEYADGLHVESKRVEPKRADAALFATMNARLAEAETREAKARYEWEMARGATAAWREAVKVARG